jgi:uncharacterized tellurite resistance protein B-like protein
MKTTTGRQTSGFLVQGTVRLASAPQSSLSTGALRKIGNGVFAGYVALALVSVSYSALQARRFGVAYAALRSCLAQADSACANTELERARSIRGSDVRVQLADATLAVLLHQLERAVSVELALEAQEKAGEVSLGGDARADLLLLRGDIAWAQGNVSEARDDFNSAKPLLPAARGTGARVIPARTMRSSRSIGIASIAITRIELSGLEARADGLAATSTRVTELQVAVETGLELSALAQEESARSLRMRAAGS